MAKKDGKGDTELRLEQVAELVFEIIRAKKLRGAPRLRRDESIKI